MGYGRERSACWGTRGRSPAVGLVIVEGLADALALASRSPETAAAGGGVSGLQADRFLDWLSQRAGVTAYADNDPDGVDSARRLRRLLAHRGLEIAVYTLTGDHNDPGDFAENNAVLILECEKRNYGSKPPFICLDREGGVLTERQAPDWAAGAPAIETSANGSHNYKDVV